jgi:deoxyribodipyrimidine photolyase-related protein
MHFLILPNQLFETKYIDKSYKIIIWECPHFFTDYKYNKKKLVLHRASMKYYYDYLKSNGYNVEYLNYDDKLDINKEYLIYYPINKIDVLGLPKKCKIYNKETPNLLLSSTLIKEYRNKTNKFFFNAFYMWSKKKLNIIPNIKSYDKDNRDKPKEKLQINQPFNDIKSSMSIKYIKDAIEYVNKKFKNNYGNTNNFIYPITHKESLIWLEHFIKNKMKRFGNYQDYIHIEDPYLYHSLLSALINIGLLNPIDIIKIISKYKSSIPINSYEGFIRQLFWREYQHYCYLYVDFNANYFGNNKRITKEWYSGTTGIKPIDDSIKEAFDLGYLHHIKRLMLIGNYMNLCQISPKDGFKWFMEFSCDSYAWVMYQNVYDMVFFVTGGITMRRPYISSSNYIIKMSNYKREKWADIWDKKYTTFINKNKKRLWKYRYYVRIA